MSGVELIFHLSNTIIKWYDFFCGHYTSWQHACTTTGKWYLERTKYTQPSYLERTKYTQPSW
jgi:hypothetical protein